ncbi:MAG: LamG-like jellyroll fold domain-containing protein [Desulfuromonadales bacterium]
MKRLLFILVALCSMYGGIVHADITSGLVAYYPFNGNANDVSGNGNNGTVYGATLTTDRFGNANNAYTFDCVGNYIKTPPIQKFFTDESVTLSVWFKPDSGGVIIDEKDNFDYPGWQDSQIEILNSGMVSIKVWDLPKVDLGVVTFGTWHHVVLRYSKAELKLDGFLDGRVSASITGDRTAPFEQYLQLTYGFGQLLNIGLPTILAPTNLSQQTQSAMLMSILYRRLKVSGLRR